MSRKHFEAIAKRLATARRLAHNQGERDTIHELAQCLATDFAKFNPNFDIQRFMEATRV
jgi:hypothetical protein